MAIIYIPKTVPELIELSEQILKKHLQQGEKSPLAHLNMQQLKDVLNEMKIKHEEYLVFKEKCDRMKEDIQLIFGTHREQKNIENGTIRFTTVQVRDVLKGIHRERLEALREWGYTVITKEK